MCERLAGHHLSPYLKTEEDEWHTKAVGCCGEGRQCHRLAGRAQDHKKKMARGARLFCV